MIVIVVIENNLKIKIFNECGGVNDNPVLCSLNFSGSLQTAKQTDL